MSDVQMMIPATGWWARYEHHRPGTPLFDASTDRCYLPVIAWVLRNGMVEGVVPGTPVRPTIPGVPKSHKGMKFVGFEFDLIPSLAERHG